jgi:hypothetical protein
MKKPTLDESTTIHEKAKRFILETARIYSKDVENAHEHALELCISLRDDLNQFIEEQDYTVDDLFKNNVL